MKNLVAAILLIVCAETPGAVPAGPPPEHGDARAVLSVMQAIKTPPMNQSDPSIRYGTAVNGVRIGLWSESASYGFYQLPNIWKMVDRDPATSAGAAAAELWPRRSTLVVTHPDGSVSKASLGPLRNGDPEFGGISSHLYAAIQTPGVYKVRWIAKGIESPELAFTITAEPEPASARPGMAQFESMRKARGAVDQMVRAAAASRGYEPLFAGGSDRGEETWVIFDKDFNDEIRETPSYVIAAYNTVTGAVRWVPIE